MKRALFVFGFIALLAGLLATPPAWVWVQRTGGTGECRTTCTLEDSQGRIVVCGYFSGTVEFGTQTLVASGVRDAFLAQMDSGGNWLWAVQMGGEGTDYARKMTLEANDCIVVGGTFDQSFSLGEYELDNSGQQDFYLARYSSEGNLLEATAFGSAEHDVLQGLDVGPGGEINLCGSFRYSLSLGEIALTTPNRGIFIAKLDDDLNPLWAHAVPNSTGDLECNNLGTDTAGNIYLTGNFYDYCSFGQPNAINLSGDGSCGFVIKLDPSGNGIWGERVGNGYCIISDSYIDPEGYTYLSADVVMEPFSVDRLDIIPNCAKLGPDGAWVWVDNSTNLGACYYVRICGDEQGNCFLTGSLWDDCSFGDYPLTGSFDEMNIFVGKGDSQGVWQWGIQGYDSSGTLFANASEIIASQGDRCVVTGYNNAATLYFGDFVLPPAAQTYSWYIRTHGTTVGNLDPHEIPSPGLVSLYPNPSSEQLRIRPESGFSTGSTVEIYNLRGQLVKRFSNLKQDETELLWDGKDAKGLDCSPGLYFLKVLSSTHSIVKPFTRL